MRKKLELIIAGLFVTLTAPAVAQAGQWTPWVSEENGGPSALCPSWTSAAAGFDCDLTHCDNVRMYCDTLPYGITVNHYNVTSFFSEEDNGIGSVTSVGWYRYDNSFSHVCYYAGSAGILTGISCSGLWCDNISLECAIPYTNFEGATEPVELTNCSWTDYYDNADPPLVLPYNRFITGVGCYGPYCQSKRFYVCSMQNSPDSCSSACGGPSRSGTCYCDEACTSYGDCCSDYEAVCVPF